jgi:hypothetical protein
MMQSKAVHFITFQNSGYSKSHRILSQAKESKFFETTTVYSEKSLVSQIVRHPLHFLINRKRGFGTFIWKPYVIYKHLIGLADWDWLVYADLGVHINALAATRFREMLDQLTRENSNLGVFSVGSAYDPFKFVSARAVRSYYPEFYESNVPYVYAGLLVLRNNAQTRRMVKDWLQLCEGVLPRSYSLFSRLLSLFTPRGEIEGFIGQDGDNGLLPLVLAKHGGYSVLEGREVNLYNESGIQLAHCLSNEEYDKLDWGVLKDSPFTLRRDR